MTREEIKDELYRMLSDVVNVGYPGMSDTQGDRYKEAVKLAIKALEQEPCENMVSRQAVIDATVKKNSIWNSITNSKGENLEEIISQLPPVAPQIKIGHWIELGYVGNDNYDFECSECHHTDTHSKTVKVNYCWCCGIKMEVEE